MDQVYSIDDWRVQNIVCITNKPSLGSLRGFGTPQGHMIMENIIDNIAVKCGITQVQVRQQQYTVCILDDQFIVHNKI